MSNAITYWNSIRDWIHCNDIHSTSFLCHVLNIEPRHGHYMTITDGEISINIFVKNHRDIAPNDVILIQGSEIVANANKQNIVVISEKATFVANNDDISFGEKAIFCGHHQLSPNFNQNVKHLKNTNNSFIYEPNNDTMNFLKHIYMIVIGKDVEKNNDKFIEYIYDAKTNKSNRKLIISFNIFWMFAVMSSKPITATIIGTMIQRDIDNSKGERNAALQAMVQLNDKLIMENVAYSFLDIRWDKTQKRFVFFVPKHDEILCLNAYCSPQNVMAIWNKWLEKTVTFEMRENHFVYDHQYWQVTDIKNKEININIKFECKGFAKKMRNIIKTPIIRKSLTQKWIKCNNLNAWNQLIMNASGNYIHFTVEEIKHFINIIKFNYYHIYKDKNKLHSSLTAIQRIVNSSFVLNDKLIEYIINNIKEILINEFSIIDHCHDEFINELIVTLKIIHKIASNKQNKAALYDIVINSTINDLCCIFKENKNMNVNKALTLILIQYITNCNEKWKYHILCHAMYAIINSSVWNTSLNPYYAHSAISAINNESTKEAIQILQRCSKIDKNYNNNTASYQSTYPSTYSSASYPSTYSSTNSSTNPSTNSSTTSKSKIDDDLEKHEYFRSIVQPLGTGSYGEVYAICNNQYETFAVKVMQKSDRNIDGKMAKNEFEKFNIIRNNGHENLIHCAEYFESNTAFYFIYEYCDGDLFELLKSKQVTNRYWTVNEIKSIFSSICCGMQHCHKLKIVHRDLKLENILWKKCMNGIKIKIADFGLSRCFGSDISGIKTVCGTPQYLAPEIIHNKFNKNNEIYYDEKCDIWSMGVILFELLFGGEVPFKDISDAYFNNLIIPKSTPVYGDIIDAVDLCKKLLIKDPLKRFDIKDIKNHKWFKSIVNNNNNNNNNNNDNDVEMNGNIGDDDDDDDDEIMT